MNIENIITSLENFPIVLDVDHVTQILGISKPLVYGLCNDKDFPAVKVGNRRIIIPKAAFEDWLRNPKNKDGR